MKQAKIKPTFDKYCYPSKETLEAIENWDYRDIEGLLKFMAKAWFYPEYAQEIRPGLWCFDTRGWTGNKNLIKALEQSFIWPLIRWNTIKLSDKLLIIAISDETQKELEKMKEKIIKWMKEGR